MCADKDAYDELGETHKETYTIVNKHWLDQLIETGDLETEKFGFVFSGFTFNFLPSQYPEDTLTELNEKILYQSGDIEQEF